MIADLLQISFSRFFDAILCRGVLGLLMKRSDPADARHIVVGLSRSGERAARDASKIMREVEARMMAGLSGVDRR